MSEVVEGPTREPVDTLAPPPVPAAFFAEVRRELGRETEVRPLQVRDSLVAAMLAGLIVGCALAGFEIADVGQAIQPLAKLLGIDPRAVSVVPFVLLLGLIGGGRAAATSLLLAHKTLKRLRRTDHLSYAFGGAVAAVAVAAVLGLVIGTAPTHGWLIDALGGAVGGFFYRVFAGLRPAAP